LGVTQHDPAGYNSLGMIPDAPPKSQFASARVLDTLSRVPAPLSGSATLAGASQLIR
jgi:hypothetical protein